MPAKKPVGSKNINLKVIYTGISAGNKILRALNSVQSIIFLEMKEYNLLIISRVIIKQQLLV